MKLLVITTADARGFSIADQLSTEHDIAVLHTDSILFECPYPDAVIDEKVLRTYPFDDFQRIIYLTSPRLSYNYLTIVLERLKDFPDTSIICISERAINLTAKQESVTEMYICEGFRNILGDRLSFWYTATIYGEDFLPGELCLMLERREMQNQIIIPGNMTDSFEAIHVSDLVTAIELYSYGSESTWPIFLSVHQRSTLEDLGSSLHNLLPQSEITYSSDEQNHSIQGHDEDDTVDKAIFINEKWMPKHRFFQDLPSVMKTIETEKTRIDYSTHPRKANKLLRIVIFLGLFAAICVYSGFMRVSSELQFVDFKLLFVIGACLFWGRSYGLTAAVLCSIASVVQSISGGTKWYVIFFHIDNWIPIATYLASAVLFGMYRDNRIKEDFRE